jgi:hypothetical protein
VFVHRQTLPLLLMGGTALGLLARLKFVVDALVDDNAIVAVTKLATSGETNTLPVVHRILCCRYYFSLSLSWHPNTCATQIRPWSSWRWARMVPSLVYNFSFFSFLGSKGHWWLEYRRRRRRRRQTKTHSRGRRRHSTHQCSLLPKKEIIMNHVKYKPMAAKNDLLIQES